jgi:hypothetical protein
MHKEHKFHFAKQQQAQRNNVKPVSTLLILDIISKNEGFCSSPRLHDLHYVSSRCSAELNAR